MHEDKVLDEYKYKLMKAVMLLESEDECVNFFEDLCTINEINSMAQRLAVAVMLKNGDTFNNIADKTGASTATISRVNKALRYGSGGYESVLPKLDCTEM